MKPLDVFNLMGWIEENKEFLRPPISNETIYKGNDNYIVMVSGGPNSRKDYHYNESEELFLQLKGSIEVGLYINGEHTTVYLNEGDMFLCPAKMPHQPRRFEDTYGLIIEKHRETGEKDGLMYFCDDCGELLYEEYFFLEDIVQQFPMVQHNFYGSETHRTCKNCGAVMELPPNWDQSIETMREDNPFAEDAYAQVYGESH
jgi:3-hydroxyanthranilate 3,4-dioxygenase